MSGVSRTHKLGTIFSRVTGLLRSGALAEEDRPVWYDVYQRFPPYTEPRYDKIVDVKPVKNIFYPEDIIRAKFYKTYPGALAGVLDLQDEATQSLANRFIHSFFAHHKSGEHKTEQSAWDAAANDLGMLSDSAEMRARMPRGPTRSTSTVTSQHQEKKDDKS